MSYSDKYHLNPDQSLFLAKRKWDENVYCGMKMENRAVTFPQTKTILEGVNVPNIQLNDIQAILNMRDAWRFLLGSMGAIAVHQELQRRKRQKARKVQRAGQPGARRVADKGKLYVYDMNAAA